MTAAAGSIYVPIVSTECWPSRAFECYAAWGPIDDFSEAL